MNVTRAHMVALSDASKQNLRICNKRPSKERGDKLRELFFILKREREERA
tara:strand:+ start:765 stop:914 length:150 start_codon:yes stop_codon:yes gene_type:complete